MSLGSALAPFFGAAGAAGGGAAPLVERSLRLDPDRSSYLYRDVTSAGNQKTWTWSAWVKLGYSSSYLFGAGNEFYIYVYDTGQLRLSTNTAGINSTRRFRDYGGWMHLVVAVDTTQYTQSDRIKVFVNGVQDTSTDYGAIVSQNQNTTVNSVTRHNLGKSSVVSQYAQCYLADFYFIDGLALTPNWFGYTNTDTSVWDPKLFEPGLATVNDGTTWSAVSGALGSAAYDGSTQTSFAAVNGTYYKIAPLLEINYRLRVFIRQDEQWQYYSSETTVFNLPRAATLSYGWVDITEAARLYSKTVTGTQTNPFIRVTSGGSPIYAVEVDGIIMQDGVTTTMSYGTNGVHLLFDDNSTASALGTDSSGGGRNWTVSGPSVTPGINNDSLFDSPNVGQQSDTGLGGQVSGNYCTWNPLVGRATDSGQTGISPSFNNGSLKATGGQTNDRIAATYDFTVGSSEKVYWEVEFLGTPASSNGAGVRDYSAGTSTQVLKVWYYDGTTGDGGPNVTFTTGDILGFAMDLSAGTIDCYKNGGTSIGQMDISGLTSVTPFVSANSGVAVSGNFGQRAYEHPVAGYKTLSSATITDPAVIKSRENFDIQLWTGNGASNLYVGGYDLAPGILWMKNRGTTVTNHAIFDRIRDAAVQFKEYLSPNNNLTETATDGALENWYSDGFLMANGATVKVFNIQNEPYVGWSWYSGSTTVNNTDGDIPAEVRANVSAGISTVVYTGTSSASNVGHGLGVAPEWVFIKPRDINGDWIIYHAGFGNAYNTYFNQTLGKTPSTNYPSPPDATKIYLSNSSEVNGSTSSYVAYCFAPISGFSKFGLYTGNGQNEGTFVYTGFRPRWLLCKSENTSAWYLFDSERDGYNVDNDPLYPNLDIGEQQDDIVDILSNGFKFRRTTEPNTSSTQYEYMAFAENPFKYSRAR